MSNNVVTVPAIAVWLGDTLVDGKGRGFLVVEHITPWSIWTNGGATETRMLQYLGTNGTKRSVRVDTEVTVIKKSPAWTREDYRPVPAKYNPALGYVPGKEK